MGNATLGKLINNAGAGKYTNPDAPKKVIEYITRTNGKPDNDLIAWGGLGVLECSGINSIINQFYAVQQLHTRRGAFGRYIDHEIFSFSPNGEYLLSRNNLDIDKIARNMADDIYRHDHCQVIYGVHYPNKYNAHLHIHFAINTVNFYTGNKRRENKRKTADREERFEKIILNEIAASQQPRCKHTGHQARYDAEHRGM